jgi:broad specificity phosphatase PhoE
LILLARHGQTDDNRPPLRFQGRTDTPLNDNGRAQAAELAQRLEHEPLEALYTSDLIRARETAEIVGGAIGLEPVVDARFAESDRGEWEGRSFEEVERDDPAGFAAFQRAGEDFRFPGGESLREHMDRVIAALADVTQAGRLPALVVCHGGSIRVALCHTDERGLDAFWDWDVPNVALVRL